MTRAYWINPFTVVHDHGRPAAYASWPARLTALGDGAEREIRIVEAVES